MPNKKNGVSNKHVVTSNQSEQSFKPRLLTLLRKDRKRDEEKDEWYHTPTVTLAGQWLYDAGFRSGQRIEIVVENRQLVIRVEREPRELPDKKLTFAQWEREYEKWIQSTKPTEKPFRQRKSAKNNYERKPLFFE
ncbi:MAG: type I toxin-antitoxin system SymE family toxin [Tannerellaceae bacterium]|nr:type I toxin-antitoxin system SymE family toxin [Tannerellaceae bacterium]